MTLFRLALRAQRTGLIATACIGAVSGLANGVGYLQIAGRTVPERTVFARQMEILGQQFSYILPPPRELDTIGGYLTWRNFGTVALVYAIWAVLAATGAARGDEERQLTGLWLASGVSRPRWLATRALGFLAAALASLTAGLAVTALGAALAGDPLPLGGIALEGLDLLGLALWAFGLGLAAAQLVMTRRAAALAAGGIVLGLFFANSAVRTGADPGPLAWLSPFTLFDRSTPLLRGATVDPGALGALAASAAVLGVIALALFLRRDIDDTALRRPRPAGPASAPAPSALLRLPVLALVRQQRAWIAGWSLGLALLAYLLVSISRLLVDTLRAGAPGLQQYFVAAGIAGYADFIGVAWFGTALLFISVFVVVQASGWAADDAEGRLELVLAQPVSRTRVVLERAAALLVAVGIIAALSTLSAALSARAGGIDLPAGRTALAALLMLPVAFALGGPGLALVAWRPRLAVLVLGAVTVVSYFTQQLAPVFGWPDWVRRTSVFALYGQPLARDDWPGIAILVAAGAAGTLVALVALRRRDVGS